MENQPIRRPRQFLPYKPKVAVVGQSVLKPLTRAAAIPPV